MVLGQKVHLQLRIWIDGIAMGHGRHVVSSTFPSRDFRKLADSVDTW